MRTQRLKLEKLEATQEQAQHNLALKQKKAMDALVSKQRAAMKPHSAKLKHLLDVEQSATIACIQNGVDVSIL